MTALKKSQKFLLFLNTIVIAAIFVLIYFYQLNGFDFTLKCVCSGLFSVLGLINLGYAFKAHQPNLKFYIGIAAGLLLAFLGDYLIGYDFIVGAATFVLGHICFVIAYCFLQKMQKIDFLISGLLFLGCLIFLLFFPLLTFDVPFFRIVCIVYALIISTMLGKAVGNFIREKSIVTGTIAAASFLFFFRSDTCIRLVHRSLELDRSRLYGNVLSRALLPCFFHDAESRCRQKTQEFMTIFPASPELYPGIFSSKTDNGRGALPLPLFTIIQI